MKKYEVEAIKEEDQKVVDNWAISTYENKEEAIEEAKSIAEGASSINAKLMGYNEILVHEVSYDEWEEPINSEEIESFEVDY